MASGNTPAKSTSSGKSLDDLLSSKKDDNKVKAETAKTEETKTDKTDIDKNNDGANDKAPDLPVGPEGDDNKIPTVVRPEDIKEPVDNSPSVTSTQVSDKDKADKAVISENVVGTVPNRTPAELAAETPKQTAERYGVDQTITDEDADNPRVDVYRDTHVNQVPSGTHLHPDIAKDLLNRGISEQHTDNAQVKRTTTEYYSFAPDAEHNDKL